jgi:NADH:ubiquinone oxidoreductase subunit 2 (subunit N)
MDFFNLHNLQYDSIINLVAKISFFLDLYFVLLIVIIIFMRLIMKKLELAYFEKMVKVIILGLILYIFLLYKGLSILSFNDIHTITFWNNHFIYSPIIFYIKIFICVLSICIFIAMLDYFYYEKYGSYELLILILLSLEGMFLMISTNDFFLMYISIELQSISLYILASIKRYSNLSVEAGLKYFIYGSFASGMLLFGISLVYGSLGITDFTNMYLLLYMLSQDASVLPLSLVYGFLLILAGLFFKLGITPFHF